MSVGVLTLAQVRTSDGALRVVESRMIQVVTHGGCHENQGVELRQLLLKKHTWFLLQVCCHGYNEGRVCDASLAQEQFS